MFWFIQDSMWGTLQSRKWGKLTNSLLADSTFVHQGEQLSFVVLFPPIEAPAASTSSLFSHVCFSMVSFWRWTPPQSILETLNYIFPILSSLRDGVLNEHTLLCYIIADSFTTDVSHWAARLWFFATVVWRGSVRKRWCHTLLQSCCQFEINQPTRQSSQSTSVNRCFLSFGCTCDL